MTPRIQLRDIARAVGVSATSVSLALRDDPRISEPTRLRIHGVARELGYVGVRRRSVEPLRRFGFIHCDPEASGAFYQCEPILRLIMRDAPAMHVRFEVLSIDAALEDTTSRQTLFDFASKLEGVLLFGRVHAPILRALHQLKIPTVVIGETDVAYAQANELKMQRVTDDPMRAGLAAGEYLLKQRGCRRIAFVTGLREPGLYYDQWHRGLVFAHAQAGVPLDERRVLWHERGNKLTGRIGQLLEPDIRPDAIVWPDAGFAATFLDGLRSAGLVLSDADQVVGGVAHVPVAESVERLPQIMADLTTMTKEAIRRLKVIAKTGADSATTITVAHVLRNFVTEGEPRG